MASITGTLERIKRQPLEQVDAGMIEQACEDLDYRWRDGPLNPTATVGLFIQQIIEGNCSCQAVRHLSEQAFSGSAYCQARSRLPRGVLEQIGQRVVQAHQREADFHFKTHRTFHIDGSSFSMPDTPELQKYFGQSGQKKKGCGFPTAHLLTLFDARSGLILQGIASPLRTHDMSKAAALHPAMHPNDLLIGDTSFGTWAHFALLLQGKMHGLFPNHQRRIVSFRPRRRHRKPGKFKAADKGKPTSRFVKRLGKNDQLVQWFKPPDRPQWMSQDQYDALPDSIRVREVRRVVGRKGFRSRLVTLVTTLLDPEIYPADELMQLVERRWDVETNLRHLKTTMKMDVLKCKSVPAVLKELSVFLLVYNLVRLVMLQAARRQEVSVARISFADALTWLRQARVGDRLPELIVNPWRPDRIEPRCIKRRPKPYDLMMRPRQVLRNRLEKQWKSA
jgi:hypothetical protein